MKRFFEKTSSRLAVLVIAGTLAIAGTTLAISGKEDKKPAPKLHIPVDNRPVQRVAPERNSFAPVVKQVSPGVVKVFTTAKVEPAAYPGSAPMDDLMRRFFGTPFGPRGQQPYGMPRQRGVGSGVIATKDGYILTNNHVVENAEVVNVTLSDGRELTAKVIGRDPKTDIAVIKVDGKELPTVPMADSDQVEVGDMVLAIGNPFGIGQTVTMGIVSATGRGNMGLDYEDFIQTDAAINPGNSGGALVDVEGRLIGINTAILSRSGGNQGIGFAIPSNLAREVMHSLITDGHVTRGYLGVLIQDITPALAKQFELDGVKGALVGDVTPNSPAAKAGIKSGDVIVEFNGKPVAQSRQLKLAVGLSKPGQTIPVKISRDGSAKTVQVTIKSLPENNEVAQNSSHGEDTGVLTGVAVDDLTSEMRSELRVPASVKGALVVEVAPDSAAAEAGLQRGDIIQEINRKPVRDAQGLVELTRKAEDKATLLRVWREGSSRFVVVDETHSKEQ